MSKLGKNMIGQFVIVRCRNAGVHMGTLVDRIGSTVELKDARRLWRWRGANTLNEVAGGGVDITQHTRISDRIHSIVLTEACEVIPTTALAKEKLDRSIWL